MIRCADVEGYRVDCLGGVSYSCYALGLVGYATERQCANAVRRFLKARAAKLAQVSR